MNTDAVLELARLADDDAFLCDFGGQMAVNLPNLDRVVVIGVDPVSRAHARRPATTPESITRLDVDTLLYVRESVAGILDIQPHTGRPLDAALPLIDEIIRLREDAATPSEPEPPALPNGRPLQASFHRSGCRYALFGPRDDSECICGPYREGV